MMANDNKTIPPEGNNILEIKDLQTSFFTKEGEIKAVNHISYTVKQGEMVALVGESGSGKSVSLLSILQLVQTPAGRVLGGQILYQGRDLLALNKKEMRKIRGAEISMVFQEPMTSLNPVYTIGNQLTEVIRAHDKSLNKKAAWEKGIDALAAVGIPDPAQRMKNYPFEMSGGMRQRVMIALAIACNSKLILADEPTTALDVTTQAQVMELLLGLVRERNISVVMVTHNLGLVSRYANRTNIMYAGRIVESGTTEELLTNPGHPYAKGLLEAVPRLDMDKGIPLIPISGAPPKLAALPEYCSFYSRCPYACNMCREREYPQLNDYHGNPNHKVACHVKNGGESHGGI